jgi:hypothetical protein
MATKLREGELHANSSDFSDFYFPPNQVTRVEIMKESSITLHHTTQLSFLRLNLICALFKKDLGRQSLPSLAQKRHNRKEWDLEKISW